MSLLDLPPDVRLTVIQQVTSFEITSLLLTCTSLKNEIYEDKVWKDLLKKEYSFVTLKQFVTWNFRYDSLALSETSNREMFRSIHSELYQWSDIFLSWHTILDMRFVKEQEIIREIMEHIAYTLKEYFEKFWGRNASGGIELFLEDISIAEKLLEISNATYDRECFRVIFERWKGSAESHLRSLLEKFVI